VEAIRNLKSRYLSACDKKDVATIRDCFIDEEMVIDYGPVGSFNHRDQLLDLYEKFACNDQVLDMHLGGNPQIEVLDDSHARGEWCLYFFQIHTGMQTVMLLGGYYADEYRKVNGEWKISRCVFKPHVTETMKMEEGLHRIRFAGRAVPKFGEA
jgi:hypothetical protein